MSAQSDKYWFLLPFAWLYGLVVWIRNKCFDWQLIASHSYSLPVICVGNLAVGGTGKTPHTEYLIKLLQQEGYHVAVLSRGYKRKTHGFVLANKHTQSHDIGDEPYQLKQKFPSVTIAVDERRREGIERLMSIDMPKIDVIILDDAFQHRYVKAGLNIVVTDYHRLYANDWLLPAGRLREPSTGASRAQIIMVSKCPAEGLTNECCSKVMKHLSPATSQHVYFSSVAYNAPYPLVGNKTLQTDKRHNVLLVTGIANPKYLRNHISSYADNVVALDFPDHHAFSAKDVQRIEEELNKQGDSEAIIVTTEKDAARMINNELFTTKLLQRTFVQPIVVNILQDKQQSFNRLILDYVTENSRNS